MGLARRLWALRERRPGFVALAVLVLVALLVFPAVEALFRAVDPKAQAINFQDLTVYEFAVDRWRAGEPIYVPNDDGGYWGNYLYPPVFLVLFRPFAALGHEAAGIAWGVTTTLLLWVALQSVAAGLGVSLRLHERLIGLWALVGFYPVLLSFKLGQTAALLGALLSFALAGLLAEDRSRALLSGAATGAVGVVKFAYAPVGAHLLADRDRLVGAVVAGVGLVALSVGLFGLDTNLAYLDVLVWGVDQGGGERLPKAYLWFPPYFRQLHWLPGALFVRLGIAGLVAAGAALAVDAGRSVFALGVAAFLLITPLPYVYYFVAALPAVLALLSVEFEADGAPSLVLVALLLLQVHAYGLKLLVDRLPALLGGLPDVVYPLLQPGLWGVLLLFGLAARRVVAAVPPSRVVEDRTAARGD